MTKLLQFTRFALTLSPRLQPSTFFPGRRRSPASLAGIALVLLVFSIAGGAENANASPEAKALLLEKGCGGCHLIPGVEDAYGEAGPSLKGMKTRKRLLGGKLKNTPENMRAWLMNPGSVKSGTVMPNLGLTNEDADIMIEYFKKI
ncbi:MAG: c-type cytochrome [Alphaproteobacteria bacterium]|jgi:cytochrome c2|nr:c-type cytochrome [Alphaproteobacteria bacterium]MBT4084688.1 c-type cytochrome [Alphaproteobacteria bacterium]MBT4544644.1 c-type cytochrome [Alphaproteobacteria bacterium]MBT5920332.1 c-type cytochrome [Alphaproteobacteria bacterium]MBT7744942.1 c-type cytochrome [Alphaproteobacteria bacterium]